MQCGRREKTVDRRDRAAHLRKEPAPPVRNREVHGKHPPLEPVRKLMVEPKPQFLPAFPVRERLDALADLSKRQDLTL
jgi:hypothetical protein